MTDAFKTRDPAATPPIPAEELSDETISLKPMLRLLADYRRVIALAVLSAVALCGALLLALAIVLPRERTGSMEVRLLFDGAAGGYYPNGTIFSPAEIVATPVLSDVYRANDLQRFGTYGDFKESMGVLRSSLAQNQLTTSYATRLADTRLSATERARLEDEFRQRREGVSDPVYTLVLRRHERLKAMPPALMEKVLNDTLTTWAEQADELKGVRRFDVPVFSQNLLRPDVLDSDFLIAADGLRIQAHRAADLVRTLLQVPGATTVRSQKDQASLSDVSFDIADVLRNQIDPLVHLIEDRGLTNSAALVAQYLRARVVELRLERDSTRSRIAALQDALQGYMATRGTRVREGSAGTGTTGRPAPGPDTQTVIPQLSESFLDRILNMSTQAQASDVEYRKALTDRIIKEGEILAAVERSTAYYEGLEKNLRPGSRDVPEAQAAAVKAQLRSAYDALAKTTTRLITLYEDVSAQRLNPAAALYAVSDPFKTTTAYALTRRTVLLSLALSLLLSFILAPIGCAIHRHTVRQARAPHAR